MRCLAVLPVLACFAWAITGADASPAGPHYQAPTPLLQDPASPSAYAAWAHAHWVWLPSSKSNASSMTAYAAEYAAHNITVGAVNLDSLWSTGVDNFIPDPHKYPDGMGAFTAAMHAAGKRVICWATAVVDTTSSNYGELLAGDYYIRNALGENSTFKWWHGHGMLVDFYNEPARAWWQQQMDNVLQYNIDGFKLDGVSPYLLEYIEPRSWNASVGVVQLHDYQHQYYGQMLNYTRATVGDHALIMSRPVDSYPVPVDKNLSLFLTFSPKYAMTSGWVGDQDPTFDGLRYALANMYFSALSGYANYGSDTGGYRVSPTPLPLGRTPELFIRWTGLSAFCPLFENGGEGEHRPWMFDSPGSTAILDAYRRYVQVHYQLQPYFLSVGNEALASGRSVMHFTQPAPPGWPADTIQANALQDNSYLLGDAYFVVPVAQSGQAALSVAFPNSTMLCRQATVLGAARTSLLPRPGAPGLRGTQPSASAQCDDSLPVSWSSFWGDSPAYPGGTRAVLNVSDLLTMPVFVASNTLIPLHVSSAATLLGTAEHARALTVFSRVELPAHAAASDTSVLSMARRLHRVRELGGVVSMHVRKLADGSVSVDVHVTRWAARHGQLRLVLHGLQASRSARAQACMSSHTCSTIPRHTDVPRWARMPASAALADSSAAQSWVSFEQDEGAPSATAEQDAPLSSWSFSPAAATTLRQDTLEILVQPASTIGSQPFRVHLSGLTG